MANIDEQFELEAQKFQIRKEQAVANIEKALADLGQICEEHGFPYTYSFEGQYRAQYTPKTIKKWEDVSEDLKDEYNAWGSHYDQFGWSSSAIC